jgi:hypothetical protein
MAVVRPLPNDAFALGLEDCSVNRRAVKLLLVMGSRLQVVKRVNSDVLLQLCATSLPDLLGKFWHV